MLQTILRGCSFQPLLVVARSNRRGCRCVVSFVYVQNNLVKSQFNFALNRAHSQPVIVVMPAIGV
jgi:hypothetical protein